MNVIQQTKGIDPFFHALFGFMRRKTDFFTDDKMARSKINEIFESHLV